MSEELTPVSDSEQINYHKWLLRMGLYETLGMVTYFDKEWCKEWYDIETGKKPFPFKFL